MRCAIRRGLLVSVMLHSYGCTHQRTEEVHTPPEQVSAQPAVVSAPDPEPAPPEVVVVSEQEHAFTRCVRRADVEACRAYKVHRDPSIQEPHSREIALQSVLCEASEQRACLTLADLLFMGDGGAQPPVLGPARKAYARVCAPSAPFANPEPSCVHQVQMLRDGEGGARDVQRAAEVSQWLCEAQIWRACVMYGEMIERGDVSGAQPSRTREALDLYELAATHGDAEAERLLGERALWGVDVDQDRAVAWSHFERACEGGSPSGCAKLGMLRQFGLGVDRDFVSAASYYERACGLGETSSCVALGHLVETGLVGEGVEQAVTLYERGCEAGGMEACLNLGFMLEHGRGVVRDEERARVLYVRACRRGEEGGCHRLTQEE